MNPIILAARVGRGCEKHGLVRYTISSLGCISVQRKAREAEISDYNGQIARLGFLSCRAEGSRSRNFSLKQPTLGFRPAINVNRLLRTKILSAICLVGASASKDTRRWAGVPTQIQYATRLVGASESVDTRRATGDLLKRTQILIEQARQ